MSKEYKDELLKGTEPSGEMLYGVEVPEELIEKYKTMPLNELPNDPRQVYKSRRRDRINNKKTKGKRSY